jgi:hypothetical protein
VKDDSFIHDKSKHGYQHSNYYVKALKQQVLPKDEHKINYMRFKTHMLIFLMSNSCNLCSNLPTHECKMMDSNAYVLSVAPFH